MALESVVLETVQPSVHRFVPQETVPEAVICLLSNRKPTRLNHGVEFQHQHNPPQPSNGAHPNATFGSVKAAVTIQSAEIKVAITEERVGGLTTSQVSA